MKTFFVLLSLFISVSSQAITIDAYNYSIGDDVSDSFDATLAYYQFDEGDAEISYSPAIVGATRCHEEIISDCKIKTISSPTFENIVLSDVLEEGFPLAWARAFAGISLTSKKGPLATLHISGFSYSGDDNLIFLFGKDNNFLRRDDFFSFADQDCVEEYGQGSGGACWKYEYSSSFDDVYRVMFGSESAATYFDSVTYSTVPTPASIWLFFTGLIALFAKKHFIFIRTKKEC